MDVCRLRERRAVLDVQSQILDEFDVWIVGNDDLLRSIDGADQTWQTCTGTQFEDCLPVKETDSMFL